MIALHRLGIVACLLPLALTSHLRADEAETLKGKNLVKSGALYILDAEQEVADGMKSLRKLKVKVDQGTKQRKDLEAKLNMVKNAMLQWDQRRRQLYEEYLAANDVTVKNSKVAESRILESKLDEARTIRQELESKLHGSGEDDRNEFVNSLIELSQKVDKAADDYKELAGDPDVKDALEKLNVAGKVRFRLGPSAEFTANGNLLKRWRGDVASDTVALRHEGGVNMVDVTFNGSVTREMVLDSGASMVCLTSELANQLDLHPTDADQTIQCKLADGKIVSAKLMKVKSVRVGQFTVADVEVAVMPADLVFSEPLLGGTFLNNFIFRIDPQAAELHLAVVAGNAKVTTLSAKDAKKPSKAGAAEKMEK